MSNEMIKRVAEGIKNGMWNAQKLMGDEYYQAIAKSAIETMREPTDNMMLEGQIYTKPIDTAVAYDVYTHMIDAALKE
jgi:hypothetical protein